MKVDIRTMEGLLRGKCLPANMLVSESLSAYLVRQFDALHERAEAAERERDDLKHIQELNVKIKQAMHERFTRAEAEIARRDAAAGEVEELSMLIRKLVHSLKNSNPDSGLLKSVPDYMRRKGYWKATDCLRGDDVKQG